MKFSVRENWPGYPIGLLLCFGGVRKDFILDVMERHGCSREGCLKEWGWDADQGTQGHTAVFPCRRVMLWFADATPSAATMAHEAFHAAHGSLPQLGIKLTDDTEEVYAYAIGNLVNLIASTVAARV